jgi:arginyl-tRNA synthetase
MILPIHDTVRRRLAEAIEGRYGLDPSSQPTIALEYPPRRALGDLATPVAFELARRLRHPPRLIARELVDALGPIDGVARIEPTATGYVNVHLDRRAFLLARLRAGHGSERPARPLPAAVGLGEKVIVEHTAINPNKAAHVGHLRNAALGDTLARLLRFAGATVEVHNYIDDTGVQVADVVVGLRELEGRSLAEVAALAESPRFDHYCWDLYARVTDWYEADPARTAVRAAALRAIEHGQGDLAAMARLVAERIVRCHLATMARMNVDYDLLTWEGDILRLRFWDRTFDLLRQTGAIVRQTSGKLAGCWVMRLEEPVEADSDADEGELREKVIVRSDGTVTYVGKDIAYQFWKFGLLDRDFHYRIFCRRSDGRPLWTTTSEPPPPAEEPPPRFGHGTTVFNVIDTRQAYLQRLLRQALAATGHPEQAARSIHFAYELVALTHRTARALGFDTSAEADRPFVEVSGRKGLGVKADDLLDRLLEAAEREVGTRHPATPPEERRRLAEIIATAAVRYFLVKFSRSKLLAFDIDEALSFDGESGPYLQYAVVRAKNIFEKLRAREGVDEADLVASLPATPANALSAGEEADALWELTLEAARLDEIVDQALRTHEPAVLAKYAFGLAQTFNALYHKYPVLNEPRPDKRAWRGAVFLYFKQQLAEALALMGCEVPPKM